MGILLGIEIKWNVSFPKQPMDYSPATFAGQEGTGLQNDARTVRKTGLFLLLRITLSCCDSINL